MIGVPIAIYKQVKHHTMSADTQKIKVSDMATVHARIS